MMKKLPYLGAVLCALAFMGAAKPATAGAYGALATSPEADFGYSYNFDYAEDARRRALAECRKHSNKCVVKGTFQNVCVTIAKATNGAMGWAWGNGKSEDDDLAMSECRKNKGRNCELSTRFCTGNASD
jgi:serine/threonine-protein kinase